MGFNDGFEGSFTMPLAHTLAPFVGLLGFGIGETSYDRSRFSEALQTQSRRQAKDQATPVPPLPLQQVVLGKGYPIF
jgi:hypothetical protein